MKDLIRLILDYLLTMLLITIYSQFVYSLGGNISQDLLNHFVNPESTLLIILLLIVGIIFGISTSLGSLDTFNDENIFKVGTSLGEDLFALNFSFSHRRVYIKAHAIWSELKSKI